MLRILQLSVLVTVCLAPLFQSCQSMEENFSINDLEAQWEFSQAESNDWYPAVVPGNVHLDLFKNKIIEDPFYGNNEENLQWVEHKDWQYKGTFYVDQKLLSNQHINFKFKGLDTYADVSINGYQILSTENMFVAYDKAVKEYLVEGENTIQIYFHSPIKMAMPAFDKSNFIYPADNDRSDEHLSVFTRKAPYHYGWDWGPRFVTSGIWRPISIKAWNDAQITDVHFTQKMLSRKQAQIAFDTEVESSSQIDAKLKLIADGDIVASKSVNLQKGTNNIKLKYTIDDPELWWPNGMGEAHLYHFETRLVIDDNIADKQKQSIGLRTIEVINEPDSIGESFYLKVNGIPTFIKGVNAIPNHSFLGGVRDSIYDTYFDNVIESNMNMVRIWGGGIYEDDYFYKLANEKGILVWQDFIFGCTMYPSDDAFLNNVEKEAEYNIKRLRNHPSLAMWCGNNEIKVGWDNWGWQEKYGYTEADQKELLEGYDKLFNQLLPRKIKELDAERFYYDSSPISNWGNKADMNIADNHYWGVWWGKHEFEKMNEYVPRFMSEFGFQSFPSMETIKTFSEEKDWDIDSDVMRAHQKSSIGNVTIKEYLKRDYIMPSNFQDFVYLNQVMQAEGMRIGFEAHRRNKPFNMGTLYWQLNDVWPAVSWSGIDYLGNWKAMQYFIKKAFEPVISSAIINEGNLSVHIISDKIEDCKVSSHLQIIKLDGTMVWEQNKDFQLKANENKIILNEALTSLSKSENLNDLVLVLNTRYDKHNTQSTFLFSKVKDLKLSKGKIDYKVVSKNGIQQVILKSNTFIKNLEISASIEGRWSDNYFDLVPKQEYVIDFKSTNGKTLSTESITLKSITDTY
ncbi:beta-mannosidase [Saccharicrinis aurantiacus]|uniref:beta-mannosidase n=1 Tax=Saccharicrinis aurantiacus TaxID=1849719 RepID=UPI000837F8A4|nr:glycoside hydrolase family 2 protein [Saccharicrinis aurantiacus]